MEGGMKGIEDWREAGGWAVYRRRGGSSGSSPPGFGLLSGGCLQTDLSGSAAPNHLRCSTLCVCLKHSQKFPPTRSPSCVWSAPHPEAALIYPAVCPRSKPGTDQWAISKDGIKRLPSASAHVRVHCSALNESGFQLHSSLWRCCNC